MKNTLFYGSRILATVIVIAALSFIGIGNPKVVPFFALFFIAVFALVYFLNKGARERDREAKSGSVVGTILQILGLVVFVGVFSALGLIHGVIGYIIWFLVIAVIVALVYLTVRKRQRHFDIVSSNPSSRNMLGIILAILAIALPLLIIFLGGAVPVAQGKQVLGTVLAIVGILLFIGLVSLALILINKKGDAASNRVLGYVLVIVAAILPGIFVLFVSQDTQAIAGAYMVALITMIFTYLALDTRYQIT